jgi:hypothetical protein
MSPTKVALNSGLIVLEGTVFKRYFGETNSFV